MRLPPMEIAVERMRDVRTLAQVGDLEAFRRFVLLCAGRAGQLLNLSALGNDAGISHETARIYDSFMAPMALSGYWQIT